MLNQCQFIGNLGADPEVKSFQSGDRIANLRIAVTERWKDKQSGERKERTEWVSVVLRAGLVEVAEKYLRKGSKVFVSGKMVTRKWQDRDGNDRYSTEVVLQAFDATLILLGDGRKAPSEDDYGTTRTADRGATTRQAIDRTRVADELDDDIPF